MSFALDLTVTGKPTPRTTERPGSARKPQRPLSANRAKSVSSNIFGSPAQDGKPAVRFRAAERVKSAPHAKQSQSNTMGHVRISSIGHFGRIEIFRYRKISIFRCEK